MAKSLGETLQILQAYQPELRRRGVLHAAVFGSVARGEAGAESDVDILIELDPAHPLGVFAYASLQRSFQDLVGEGGNRCCESEHAKIPVAGCHPARRRRCLLRILLSV